jgi:regulator of protease activity HflC (stomatin/prohibitin superfamily)
MRTRYRLIEQTLKSMKKVKFLLIGLISIFALSSCQRIDAGHAGIKVNLYGDDKGVDNVTEVTGVVWYNPFTTSVYEVPTYVQNVVYTKDDIDGSENNEEFRVTTRDGLVAAFDVSMNYRTPSESVVSIFKKYRKPVNELEKGIMRTFIRDAFNNVASEYTAEELYEKRAEFEARSEKEIIETLGKEKFVVEQVVILNELRLPENVVNNINQKVAAKQIAMKKQQEVLQAKADADKKIEEARGIAESMKIKADAERYAFEQKKAALNELLVQQQFIEKWDGKLPVYGATPQLFKTITR